MDNARVAEEETLAMKKLIAMALLSILLAAPAAAEDISKKFRLSENEKIGLYYCSEEGRIVGIIYRSISSYHDLTAVTIVFSNKAPLIFLLSELGEELKNKLNDVETWLKTDPDRIFSVSCVHSFFREDWQERYDEMHEKLGAEARVYHWLLDIEPKDR